MGRIIGTHMTKDLTRSLRRHQKRRMKAKARRIYPAATIPEKFADHLAVCSCWMCGHRRGHYGPPHRELRTLLRMED